MKRGDIVIVAFPYVDGRRGKNRPALIVQNDRDNQRLTNTIVAMISGNIRNAGEPTQLLIDPSTPEGSPSGLNGVSVVKCNNLFTVAQQDIFRHVGTLPKQLMQKVDQSLKVALELP